MDTKVSTSALPTVTVPANVAKAPPHPLDGLWHIHVNDEVYGPYTGHQLKEYANDGVIDGATNVAREGRDTWTKAAEDPALSKIFVATKAPPPPSSVKAEKGATVVQITNQLGPQAALLVADGSLGPKSAGVALLFSILICGGGQLYNGQVAKGILMFIGCVVLWFVLLGWIINIWSWIDAYQTAKQKNARYIQFLANGMAR